MKSSFEKKYIKYKRKYFKLKEQLGGASMAAAEEEQISARNRMYVARMKLLLENGLPEINPDESITETGTIINGIAGYIITILGNDNKSLKKLVYINSDGKIKSVNAEGVVEKYSAVTGYYLYKIGGIIYRLKKQAFELDEFMKTQNYELMTTKPGNKKSPFGFLLSSSVMYDDGTNYKFLHLKLNNQPITTSKLKEDYIGFEKNYETQKSIYSITRVINIDEVLKLQKQEYENFKERVRRDAVAIRRRGRT